MSVRKVRQLRGALCSILKALAHDQDLRARFIRDPSRDFTRSRKLPLEKLLWLLIFRGASTLNSGLRAMFPMGGRRPSKAAMLQQQDKLRQDVFPYLLCAVSAALGRGPLFRGRFRLLACDGTNVQASAQTGADDCLFLPRKGARYAMVHVTALYDLLARRFTDAQVCGGRDPDERRDCLAMAARLDAPSILVCDRGFEGYAFLARLQDTGHYYVVRGQDVVRACGMSRRWWLLAGMPDGPGEVAVTTRLTRSRATRVLQDPAYTHLCHRQAFPLRPTSPAGAGDGSPPFRELAFRVVRVRIAQGRHEVLLTNLPPDFGPDELRRIYSLRWGVETAFRELKYCQALASLHSRTRARIVSEVYLAMVLHNIATAVAAWAQRTVAPPPPGSPARRVSFSDASGACRTFFLSPRGSPGSLMMDLARNLEPVRPGRTSPRGVRPQGFPGFTYRAT